METSRPEPEGVRPQQMPTVTDSATTSLRQVPLLSVRDLYHPVLVTILVGSTPKEYQVPRALICGQSAYFSKAFSERFKEGQTRVLELPDVEALTWEVFVGWLYTQRICHGYNKDAAGENVLTTTDDVKDVMEHGQTTLPKSWILREPQSSSKRKRSATESSESSDPGLREHKRVASDYPRPTTHEDGRPLEYRDALAGQRKEGKPKPRLPSQRPSAIESTLKDDREKTLAMVRWNDATTWPWTTLFQLYIFADKYDTRRFRTAVIETIQIKALQLRPHHYKLPSVSSLNYAFTRLPPASPLYKFLLDILTYMPCLSEPLSRCSGLSPEVLIAAWIKGKQLAAYCLCRHCKVMDDFQIDECGCNAGERCDECQHLSCEDPSHPDVKTLRPPYYVDKCQYHEHETVEERDLCMLRWEWIQEERDIPGP